MEPADHEAQQRNEALVEQLESSGALHDRRVAAAFRAILRHHFLPGRPLDEVYEDSAILIKMGERGLPLSSSSQPAIMAIMLEQLRLLPGHRVLEIGAGTGFNAALIAHLVGPDGHVVSMDIDPDLCDGARAGLERAGVRGVEIGQGDGAEGWPGGAPYDRVIASVGADDVSPAWLAQLVPEGRIVLPLGLGGPAQQCVAFERHGPRLVSRSLSPCGFMPLRGTMAPTEGPPADEVAGWLREPGRPAGHIIPAADLRAGFETWLSLTQNGCVRLRVKPEDPITFGLQDEEGLALVLGDEDQLAVTMFGAGAMAARRLALAHDLWARERPHLEQLRIVAYPTGSQPLSPAGARVVARPNFTFLVSQS